MGKKKTKGEYNDFLDGERLRDNAEIRTSLQHNATVTRYISPPPVRQDGGGSKKMGKGGPKKPPLTHFLCLPLVTDASRPQIQSGLEKLKQDLGKDGLVPTKAVRPVGTLHLTLGVMSLDDTQMGDAKQYLQALDLQSLLRDISLQNLAEEAAEAGTISENLNAAGMPDTDALTINLESLVPMQAPQKTSILYAEPKDTSQRLMPFAQALREQFTAKRFLVEDTRPLKLHATVINTIYAKSKGGRGRTKSNKLKDGLKHIEQKMSPHHHGDSQAHDTDDGVPIAGSVEDDTTAPPDPSTAESRANAGRSEGHGPDAESWMRFDARSLIEKYKGYVWAQDVRVDRVYMCKMGAQKMWSGSRKGEGEVVDEQYEVVAEKRIFE
ncbi:hypothetical protein EJ02DRAFT_104961 [Clathrospora elynae]|uniref:A-kinase anchor protein 7-like phosphoesterase domain-containing protein n=1 Tax=Clathrospora elynae TaxID=706981 RepID=A0A6A5T0L9_9PLEO|nr:hypothetical protein EJ02DRAFT_104961 [Clathrospora elynae]